MSVVVADALTEISMETSLISKVPVIAVPATKGLPPFKDVGVNDRRYASLVSHLVYRCRFRYRARFGRSR